MRTSVLKPGLLIAMKSTVSGGVEYRRTDLDANVYERASEGTQVTRWETTCVVADAAEHERAVKARAQAVAMIRGVCSVTSFGLLCSEDRESELDTVIARARLISDDFNRDAKYTRIAIYAMKGRIASTDEEAARAISDEVTSLLAAMDRGISKLDPAAIREAASKAAQMGSLLGEDQVKAVSEAVEQARKAARVIVKRVEKGGEEAAAVLQDLQRGAIQRARIAFLDFEEMNTPTTETAPTVQAQRFADLDVAEGSEDEPYTVVEGSEDEPYTSAGEVPAGTPVSECDSGETPSGDTLAAAASEAV